jgi:hypothetical protein
MKMKDKRSPYRPFINGHEFSNNICFLCGRDLRLVKRANEHTIPQWVIRRFMLGHEKINRVGCEPNSSYQNIKLRAPCCFQCNSKYLAPLEASVQNIFRKGIPSNEEERKSLAMWAGKILFCLALVDYLRYSSKGRYSSYKSVGLKTTHDLLSSIDFTILHEWLQELRGKRVSINNNISGNRYPASILVYRLKIPSGERNQFDFWTVPLTASIGMRLASLGLLVSIDGGYMQHLGPTCWNKFRELQKHQLAAIQFAEVAAHYFTLSEVVTQPFQFLYRRDKHGISLIYIPKIIKRAFNVEKVKDGHRFLEHLKNTAHFTSVEILKTGNQRTTWLEDENGKIRDLDADAEY